MERPHHSDGMASGLTSWIESDAGENVPIGNLDDLEKWLRTLMRPLVDEIRSRLNDAWEKTVWKADGRHPDDIKREKLNAMIKSAIKLQMEEVLQLFFMIGLLKVLILK